MVSFWPFKGDSTSAASFEKTLSQLSSKINKASAQNDRLRQSKRHTKALITLYGSFVYIIIALILILVTGWEQWGSVEYSAVAGGPVLIYGLRTALDAYYNYRVANSQTYLNSLISQRESTIEKLKAATKYNSTQQLLDKYGGSPQQRPGQPSQAAKKEKVPGEKSKQNRDSQGRTGFAPPPTANIPSKAPPPVPGKTNETGGAPRIPSGQHAPSPQAVPVIASSEPSEDFAPNAFTTPPRPPPSMPPSSSMYAVDGPKWYDRIMDVILGEDETSAKNRVALICQNCRLVNGQAPPGARTLEDIGRWRCSGCGAWNGVESEEKKILSQIKGNTESRPSSSAEAANAIKAEPMAAGVENENDEFEHVDEHAAD